MVQAYSKAIKPIKATKVKTPKMPPSSRKVAKKMKSLMGFAK